MRPATKGHGDASFEPPGKRLGASVDDFGAQLGLKVGRTNQEERP